jgi:methionyl aminopeptidase
MIPIKSRREIEKMRRAGAIVGDLLEQFREWIAPGVTTEELDQRAEEFIRARGGRASFKGYRGFPGSICTSLNEEVVHGIPDKRVIRSGDIVSVDVGVEFDYYHGDSARTFAVGPVSPKIQALLAAGEGSLRDALAVAGPGVRLWEVSAAIENHVRSRGFSIVKQYVGHGIGRNLHEEPQIPNYVDRASQRSNLLLKPGMTLAIEPMVNAGGEGVRVLDNGWTVVTEDRSWSVHFEHTILITEAGIEILTMAGLSPSQKPR